MDQYRKRGSPVEVEDVPPGSVYRVNDGGIISYHTKETFALLYEKIEPVPVPIDNRTTTKPEYQVSTTPNPYLPGLPGIMKVGGEAHWDGDFWVEPNGRRIPRRFVDDLPAQFGPDAVDPDHGYGNIELTKEQVLEAVKGNVLLEPFVKNFWKVGGTFSTWSEIHCFLVASGYAYTKIESTADVPPCPIYWLGESQYWIDGLAIGRACRKNEDLVHAVSEAALKIDWAAIWANKEKVGAALTAVFTTGAIAIPPLIDLLFKIKIFGG